MGTSCFERSPGPPLTGQRGFPQGHRTAAFLAGAWRCTSKKSHQLQPAAGPESVWTGALSSQAQIPSPDVPEPSTPVHKHLSGLTAEPPPPKESLASENRGLAVAPKARSLGWSRPFTRTLVTRQSWKAPPASLHGCSPLPSQAGPAPTHRGSRSPAQSLLRAGIEIL